MRKWILKTQCLTSISTRGQPSWRNIQPRNTHVYKGGEAALHYAFVKKYDGVLGRGKRERDGALCTCVRTSTTHCSNILSRKRFTGIAQAAETQNYFSKGKAIITRALTPPPPPKKKKCLEKWALHVRITGIYTYVCVRV